MLNSRSWCNKYDFSACPKYFFYMLIFKQSCKFKFIHLLIFKTRCLKVNIFSCYHSYPLNEIMIRKIKFSLQARMSVVVGYAILRQNCNLYAICRVFSYSSYLCFCEGNFGCKRGQLLPTHRQKLHRAARATQRVWSLPLHCAGFSLQPVWRIRAQLKPGNRIFCQRKLRSNLPYFPQNQDPRIRSRACL